LALVVAPGVFVQVGLQLAIAAGTWTLLVLLYIEGSQGGSEELNIGNMTEEWAFIGVPLLALTAFLFAVSLLPKSRR